MLNGRKVLYFGGTSYYALHGHQDILRASTRATLEHGIGSATSRSMTGTTPLLLELEERFARFQGSEDAAYLSSGYLSSLAGISALADQDAFDRIFLDEHSHYCNLEAARATGKPVTCFKHRNAQNLASTLSSAAPAVVRPLIISDGLFPATGQLAPVADYLKLAEKYGGVVWIDDAHGTGILGETGKGTCEHLGVTSERLYTGTTLSKAFGAYGGIIPGTASFVGQVHAGSVMTGSNSPMNAAVAASLKGLELVEAHPEWREKLWGNARYLRTLLKEMGPNLRLSEAEERVPILSCTPGNSKTMKTIQQQMLERGIYLQYTTYKGSGNAGLLRMVVCSEHTRGQIGRLAKELDQCITHPSNR